MTDCADMCACDYGDFEGAEFMYETYPVARKSHWCGECCREIVAGEQYELASGMWDGEFAKHKTCADCLSIRRAFCDCWAYGQVLCDVLEMVAESKSEMPCDERMCGITPGGKEKMFELIESAWERNERREAMFEKMRQLV